jgi:type II secretory pathway component PulC
MMGGMGRLSPPSFRDALLTTAPWALALGFALGAHAGWFCPGHEHATHVEVVPAEAVELVALDDDEPCANARRESDARRLHQLARDVHRVSETHSVPAELFALLADDPWLLAEHGRAKLVVRDGETVGYRIRGTSHQGLVRRLGLREGDILVSVGGHPIRGADDVAVAAAALRGATKLGIVVERNGMQIRKRYFIQ